MTLHVYADIQICRQNEQSISLEHTTNVYVVQAWGRPGLFRHLHST